MATVTQSFTVDDFDYLVHGDNALKMRLYRPDGTGPFPVVMDLHGGAWNNGSLAGCKDRDEALAEAGFAAAAIDFRHAGDGYPTSFIDINYAIRWLKAHAKDMNLDPDRLGISGQSSGGHLAMLAAMRPQDDRYSSVPLGDGALAIDATVRCVGMSWPVMNPLSRYRHAKRALAGEGPSDWADGMPASHDTYWDTEDAMAEGNPMLALERGEDATLPPALWVQGHPDIVHDYRDLDSDVDVNEPERFARNYRNAGGEIDVVYVDFDARLGRASFDPLIAFFRKHLT